MSWMFWLMLRGWFCIGCNSDKYERCPSEIVDILFASCIEYTGHL
jgi:hypothetical protein